MSTDLMCSQGADEGTGDPTRSPVILQPPPSSPVKRPATPVALLPPPPSQRTPSHCRRALQRPLPPPPANTTSSHGHHVLGHIEPMEASVTLELNVCNTSETSESHTHSVDSAESRTSGEQDVTSPLLSIDQVPHGGIITDLTNSEQSKMSTHTPPPSRSSPCPPCPLPPPPSLFGDGCRLLEAWVAETMMESWLRSLDLVQYHGAFIDNGYDDLETCRQIGTEDLDAIGVVIPEHREDILHAVSELRKEGGSHVYFVLDPDYEGASSSPHEQGLLGGQGPSTFPLFLHRPLPLPRTQLLEVLRDKLGRDGVDIRGLTTSLLKDDDGETSSGGHSIDSLTTTYSEELDTPYKEVSRCLRDLAYGETSSRTPSPVCGLERRSPVGSPPYGLISVYGQSPRSVPPPPLPACSPVSNNYEDLSELDPSQRGTPSHSSRCPLLPRNSEVFPDSVDGCIYDMEAKKTDSTLGRLFRSLRLWRPNKKYFYKQHDGDLKACDITMGDEERIELMIRVKDGQLSVKDALDIVKDYEQRHVLSTECPEENLIDNQDVPTEHTEL